ncbi:exonuclease, RNase T and DNA polymerase III [Rhodopirellula europaea SH398]|uniref:Exonuclease, RNase T and DNA polymerase III n=1 Tax=Rhodopirellula europaea SH398 TaxID=1263868 RepID=M5RVZ2_9BACT|nr:exonuclease, RNase T and DNA polymerase III [Rhodopirellula europaea SH398]
MFCSWGNYDRTQFEFACIQHNVAYPFGDRHINLKAEFAKANGRRKKLGVPAALRSVGLTFSGSYHRGIDDARNIGSLIPCIFPPSSCVGGSKAVRQASFGIRIVSGSVIARAYNPDERWIAKCLVL